MTKTTWTFNTAQNYQFNGGLSTGTALFVSSAPSIKLTPEQMQAIKSGKSIQLSNSPLSSWTHYQGSTYPFTGGHGVVIEKTFGPADVVVNLQALDDAFNLPLAERWASEYEVLIRGNGIGQVLDPNKETLTIEEN